MKLKNFFFALAVFFFWNSAALAHKPSDSYLILKPVNNVIEGQWDVSLRDIDFAIGLDENANNEITWQEVLNKNQEIKAYVFSRLTIKGQNQVCHIEPQETLIDHHTDGAYVVMKFTSDCGNTIDTLKIRYTLFADIDPSHRGLLKLENAKFSKTSIFGPDNPEQSFVLQTSDRLSEFRNYIHEGIWHIWIGYDHILFLISLLIPAVLIRQANHWVPSTSLNASFKDVLKIVTAFTLAHSITLSFAALHIVSLPSRWVESLIAASVILAAVNNLYTKLLKKRWLAAFVFGLIHGFGFAAVLADFGLQSSSLVLALVGFNVGVEIGQIAILSVFLPISFALRKTWFYKIVFVYTGSVVIIGVATIWLLERMFDVNLTSVL